MRELKESIIANIIAKEDLHWAAERWRYEELEGMSMDELTKLYVKLINNNKKWEQNNK